MSPNSANDASMFFLAAILACLLLIMVIWLRG